ncbi:DUF192 domain-containing protein [Conexibacter sp. W3-3-2]|uniref:DUF192 domain-containing protein n=1 Tax=Conexibacter sp. W3-3-2 TaxID=2675227 RepID=UPI0018AB9F15|nr:DUF192 domain-containing protein [Conexibacter sp. W3-3-2]
MRRSRSRLPAQVALHRPDGTVVVARCAVAQTPWTRLRGLLGRELAADAGLWIRPAASIHMFFMGYPIDAVFLDREDRVVRIVADLAPWRTASCRGARTVVELPAGTAARVGLREGETLRHEPAH